MTNAPTVPRSAPASFSRDDLRHAIAADQLVLHYQPTVSLTDGSITGFEALVRWPSPRLGLVSAANIVPAAQRWGLVRRLGDWVLLSACRRLAAWQEDVLVVPGFRVSVNVASSEMDGDLLVDRVGHAIAQSGVDPHGLVIEITETGELASPDAARRSAEGLHALGVELALDDFGSQYGTFSRLSSLPFDVLKIDRDFVVAANTEHGEAFVRALLELGDGLGARIVAEGIETADQATRLRGMGAHEGQGFLWSPGLTSDQAETLLVTGEWPLLQPTLGGNDEQTEPRHPAPREAELVLLGHEPAGAPRG